MVQVEHPWQNGPTELVSDALECLQRGSNFDRRFGFLLLDVGMETLFKTFLTMPQDVTETQMSLKDRKGAVAGNFPDLLRAIDSSAGDRLQGHNLAHVRHYHNVRNKLNHQGDGMTLTCNQAVGYARVAVGLLDALLDVDLTQQLQTTCQAAADGRRTLGEPRPPVYPDERLGSLARRVSRGPRPSRYDPLRVLLEEATQGGETRVTLSYERIEQILGAALPETARRERPWWANTFGNPQAKAWLRAGWLVDGVDMEHEQVSFRLSKKAHYPGFIAELLGGLKAQRPGVTTARKVSLQNWFAFSAGTPGFEFVWTFPRDPVLRVELYIDSGIKMENEAVYDALLAQRIDIEQAVGVSLEWERLDEHRASRISACRPFDMTTQMDAREDVIEWGVDTMIRFVDVLRPLLGGL